MSRSASGPYLPISVSASSIAGVWSGSKPNSSKTPRITSITYCRRIIRSGKMSRIPRGTDAATFFAIVSSPFLHPSRLRRVWADSSRPPPIYRPFNSYPDSFLYLHYRPPRFTRKGGKQLKKRGHFSFHAQGSLSHKTQHLRVLLERSTDERDDGYKGEF